MAAGLAAGRQWLDRGAVPQVIEEQAPITEKQWGLLMRESTIEKYLRVEVAKLGGWMEKHTSPGTKGPPDNLVMWPANHWNGFHPQSNFGTIHASRSQPFTEFIETKAPKKGPTVLQRRDHERRRAMGFQVHVISTMDQAETYLQSRGKK